MKNQFHSYRHYLLTLLNGNALTTKELTYTILWLFYVGIESYSIINSPLEVF